MPVNTLLQADLTDQIIGSFFEVYKELGFGFLESVYSNAMAVELGRRRQSVKREVPAEVFYQGVSVGTFRFDLMVGGTVVVEVKSTDRVTEADERQLLNYLRATNVEVGMLLHFGPRPKFRRFIYSNDRKQLTKE